MLQIKSFIQCSLIGILGMALSACGGGGGSDSPSSTPTYTVNGTVSGLTASGMVLQLNGAGSVSVASGATTFAMTTALTSGQTYAVTISTSPTGLTCTLTNASGTIGSANVTNVAITCAPTVSTISGTAAAGTALVGSITIKDSLGATKTVTIGTNGVYSIDVAGMSAPFVLCATGTAGGNSYAICSGAASADINGTINITPLTDLIIANIAGQVTSNYFNSGNFANLTTAQLTAQADALKARLLPILTAVGVDSSIDLLRSAFTANSTALDAVLDIVKVTVDPVTNTANILNVITQQQVTDNLASTADATVMDNVTNVGTGAGDITAINNLLTAFNAKFATSLPSPTDATLLELFTTNFLHQDTNKTDFVNEITGDPSNVGFKFANLTISSIDYTATLPIANVGFIVTDANGIQRSRDVGFQVQKGSDNVWRLHGNQRVFAWGEQHAVAWRNIKTGGVTPFSAFSWEINDPDPTNDGGTVAYALVTGPGLPAGGLRYVPQSGGGTYSIVNTGSMNVGSTGWIVSSPGSSFNVADATIAAIPDNSIYTINFYDSGDAVLQTYTDVIPKRPFTSTELAALSWPTITTPTFANFLTYVSGNLALAGTVPNSAATAEFILTQNTQGGNYREASADVVPVAGAVNASLSLTAPSPGDSITSRSIRLWSADIFGRGVATIWLNP